jgi:hypothetical protein
MRFGNIIEGHDRPPEAGEHITRKRDQSVEWDLPVCCFSHLFFRPLNRSIDRE